jgi:manganese oxidase
MMVPAGSTLFIAVFSLGTIDGPALLHDPEPIVANRNVAAAGSLRDGTLSLQLEVREGVWRPQGDEGEGIRVQAFGEAGRPLSIPGPLLRVRSGTHISITLRNTLPSTLVMHGLHTRPADGTDTVHVAPGATRSLRFAAGEPGTYFYWGSTTGHGMDEREDIDSQLSGALIIEPAEGPVAPDRVFVLGLWFQPADSSGPEPHGDREVMVINGKSWPDTERLTYTVGDPVRWRWVNPTSSSHPMHLHGFYFRVHGRGDWAAETADAEPKLVVTELMLPGGTMDIGWSPEREGNWLFHCHFAFHVSHELYLAPMPAVAHDVATAGSTTAAAIAADLHADAHPRSGVPHAMAGLVLGIHVEARPGAVHVAAPTERRRLRLIAHERTDQAAPGPRYRYTLHEAGGEPGADGADDASPPIVLRRGEPVAITVVNRLSEATSVHWHGIELESFPDGVPGWSGTMLRTLRPIAPQDSFTAEFTPPRAGTFIYHSHANELEQILGGLVGPLIVLEDGYALDADRDLIFLVSGAGTIPELLPFGMVNGRRRLPLLNLVAGETYRLRFINIGDWRMLFTLLDGDGFTPVTMLAKDGADLARPLDTPLNLLTGPGETADFAFTPEPGTYRLEFKQQLAGWIIPMEIRARR